MGAFGPCRRESSATVTQPLLMAPVLSSGLLSIETPLHGVYSPSWAIVARYYSCPFRLDSRGVSAMPQKSQAPSCLGVSIHHMLTRGLSASLLSCIMWLGLLLLQDHEDPVYYLLVTLYCPAPTAPLCGYPVSLSTALPWGRLGSPSPWRCCLQPLLLIQNLLIQVGRVRCLMALGFL